MYYQILELEKKIKGFNRIPFDFSDFLNICEQEDIRFYFYPFPAPIKGVYINLEFPVIGLKEGLKSPELELVAFQELGHYFLGHPNSFTIERSTFWLDKIEYQAKIFSALCLIPTPVLETEKDNILEQYPVEFRNFRLQIYQNYLKHKPKYFQNLTPEIILTPTLAEKNLTKVKK